MDQTSIVWSSENAEALVTEFGSPLFVYDTVVIERQYKRLRQAFNRCATRIHFAGKSLSNVNIWKFIQQLGAGFDAVSIEEVKLALHAGFDPREILFTPNSVGLAEYEEAIRLGVHINVDNLSILEELGAIYGDRVPIGIRINPHILAGGNHKISTGHIDSKFGISVHQMRHLHRIVDHYGLRIDGLHMHTGSEILDVQVFLTGAQILLDLAMDFPHLEYIDFGSGFKVAYKPNDLETDIEELGENMCGIFNEFCENYGRELELIFEPGKFLVSEAGTFLTTSQVIKQTTSTVFVGVDSGLNHFIRPMFYDSYHHIDNLSNPDGKQRIYSVVGYICETDTFAWDRPLPEVRQGDILAFRNAGAYVMSMASNYNSRLLPAEVMYINGEYRLIRRRQELNDLLRDQIEIEWNQNALS
ncbi:MAG: diaminopimelate decarboxylase [Bacteroidetes bacterium]|nr:MAG: diaminopimelate decarboxylase [Bacteroidota bacterium]